MLGMLAISLLGNSWAVAMAAIPAAGEPCAAMMASGSHGDCCDPGKPMAPDCAEHCFLLGQSAGYVPLVVLPFLGLEFPVTAAPLTRLAMGHLPALSALELRPPIST